MSLIPQQNATQAAAAQQDGSSSLIPQQTSAQQANALNPTPANVNLGPTGTFFKDPNDAYGTNLYYRAATGGPLQSFNVSSLGQGSDPNFWQNHMGQSGAAETVGRQILKDKYGVDWNSIASLSGNAGDYQNQATVAGDWNNFQSLFAGQSGTGQNQMQTVNNTPNSLASPATMAQSAQAQTQQLAGDQGKNVTLNANGTTTSTPLSTPAAQTQSNGQTTTQPAGAAGSAIDPQTGQPFTTQQLSSLDLLKQQLLGAQNALTGMGATPNALSDKYNAAFNALKDTTASTDGSAGRTAVTDALAQTDATSVTQDFMQGYGSLNAAERQLYDTIQTQLSTTNTQQTLAQQFAVAMADPNIPAGTPGESLSQEQMKLLNIDNVMKGSEDDIRAEITKAGGFATESQVQALTTARNKTLLTQATAIQQSETLKQDYISNLMNFTEKDQAQVTADLNQKLGLEQTQVTLAQNMQNAAQSNYQNIIKTNGFQGLNAALQGNPTAISAAENALGLPPGAIAREAAQESSALATAANKPLQFISGTANQAAGVFNPNVPGGQFTPLGAGPSSSSGNNGPATSSPVLSQALQTIKNSLASPTKAQLAQIDAIANNADPFAAIKNQAQNIMGQTKATQVVSYEQAQSTMQDLSKELGQYYAAGGKTDIFSGNYEDALAKLGTVNDPKLREIATEIEASLQVYRNAISGTAYSVQEGNSIASIFPGINKTEGLNDAIISGRQKAFDSVIDSAYSSVLGSNTYQALKSAYGTQYAPGSIITNNNKQYQVGADGQTITPVGGGVDLSQGANVTKNNPVFGSGQSFF